MNLIRLLLNKLAWKDVCRYLCATISTIQPHCSVNTLNELFSTAKGHSLQCDLTSKVILHFGEIKASFRIQDFLNFRRLINAIDIHSRIFDLSDESDYEFVEAPKLNIYHKLTLCELIQLRELVNGTFFAIELNSMLHQILYKDSELV